MHKILSVILFLCLGAVIYIYSTHFIYPNTTLGSTSISGYTPFQTAAYLRNQQHTSVKMQIQNRVYEYSYDKLGITVDTKATLDEVFSRNRNPFPINTLYLIQAVFVKKSYLPTITFSPDYYVFTKNTVYDLSTGTNAITVNETDKRIIYEENEQRFKVDSENLRAQIVTNFAKRVVLKPKIHKLESELQEKVAQQNEKLEKVYEEPLKVVIDDNTSAQYITLSPADLKNLITFNYQALSNFINLQLNEAVANSFIAANETVFKKNEDTKVSVNQFKYDVLSAMHARLEGADVDSVVAKVDMTSNTGGQLAQKYIEVDISQQRMYLFENGNQVGTYGVSTGLYYPTPPGSFTIMNKATNAFSDIYHVWMPYWMAFYYDPKIKAYMGIHELPYWVAGDGTQVRRPREFIGSPHTAGCVALDLGMAKIVYDFSYVGMPVHVFH